jgi:integrase
VEQAARPLHDDTLDLTDRAAGCLLLLYGQQLSRIAAMTTSQVTGRDGAVSVRFGRYDVPVPQPPGAILTELISAGRSHAGTGSPAATPWLFPGGLPGRPITAARLGQRLRNLGIYAMAGRWAALTDLAAQLPAAVLADLLHLAPEPPSTGCARPEQTGTAMPPTWPALANHQPRGITLSPPASS